VYMHATTSPSTLTLLSLVVRIVVARFERIEMI